MSLDSSDEEFVDMLADMANTDDVQDQPHEEGVDDVVRQDSRPAQSLSPTLNRSQIGINHEFESIVCIRP